MIPNEYELIVKPEAESDIDDAFQWYDRQREGLGDDFLLCVEETFERVRRNPTIYPVVHKDVRRMLIWRFPYVVFFSVEEKTIYVHGVFHGRRDPESWMQRIS